MIVQADEVARVMRDHRVPLVFLEACQSAMAEEDPTASVAGRLLDGGVASVVAMTHSVLVETARRFVGAFYRELVAGRRVGDAMLAGQRELARDTFRGRVFTGDLHLQDWFVPVLFQEELDPRLIARVPPWRVREVGAERQQEALGALPPEPDHSFVDCSPELLAIERLLTQEPYAVLLGEAGEGKTTLAAELARWLLATRRFARAAFVSLERLLDARQVLYALGEQLVPGFGAQAGGDDGWARQLVERALRDRATVVVLDNMESVLPPPSGFHEETVVTTYEPEALEALFGLVQTLLRAGETRIVFTSREALPKPFAGHPVQIGRLPRREAIELVANVLREEGKAPPAADPGKSEEEIGELVDAVACHARSLVLVARQVSEAGVRHATEHLHELMADFAERYPDERERSLFASVELSLRRLPRATRERLPRLAVFQGGGSLGVIAAVLGLDTEKDEEVALARQLGAVGLATPMPHGYLRLHPALAAAVGRELVGEEREDARGAWLEAMVGFIQSLYMLRSQNPEVAATLTLLDLTNLLEALEGVGATAGAERVVDTATNIEGLLQNLNRPRALARAVAVREAAAEAIGEWSHARFEAGRATIDRLLDASRFVEAVAVAERLVENALAAGEQAYPQARFDLASAHWYVGRVIRRSGAASASLGPLVEARRRFEELAQAGSRTAAVMAAKSVGELGDSLTDLGRLDEAAHAYQESARRAERLGDPRDSAVARGQLGTVRLLQGRYPEALKAYHEAREIFERLSEPAFIATAWHQIGSVHQEAGEYHAAEDAYRKSLRIEVERGDLWGEAATLNQLGSLAARRSRPEEAVRLYRQAAEVFLDLGDRATEGRARNNAAAEFLKLGRYKEARWELERAVECKAPYGHAAEPWKTFALLHSLEQAAGNEEAATAARERALQAYLAYRRDGGVNHSTPAELAAAVHAALTRGDPEPVEELSAELAGRQESPDLPASAHPFLQALQALLTGSRDPALAADPALDYDDAAELLLLLERLE